MTWSDGAVHFLGGVFLANATPHFVAGVSGRAFPTPFATPPFRGRSSPVVNILWSQANLGAAYLLLGVVGGLELRAGGPAAVAALGFGLMSLFVSRSLTRMQREAAGPPGGA